MPGPGFMAEHTKDLKRLNVCTRCYRLECGEVSVEAGELVLVVMPKGFLCYPCRVLPEVDRRGRGKL